MGTSFSFRVKIKQYEIEISGTREEVIETIKELPVLVAKISKAFEGMEIKMAPQSATSLIYHTLSPSLKCSEAILKLLESEWGSQPRTIAELMEALKVNAIYYPSTTLSGVLALLVKKNKIKKMEDG